MVAGERARTERGNIEALTAIDEPGCVALEHFDVGEQVVADGDRLAALEVRVAGHDRGGVFVGLGKERFLEAIDAIQQLTDFMAAIEPGIRGDLVVARAGGVEFRSGRADPFGQLRLDIHVDVFERRLELEAAAFDVGEDLFESRFDGGKLLCGQQPGVQLGAGVRDRAGDVVREQTPVVGDRLTELLDERGSVLGEAAFPHGNEGVERGK
jgi:hypothetical protein